MRHSERPPVYQELDYIPGETIVEALIRAKCAASKSEARRLVKQGGIRLFREEKKDVTRF